MKCIYCGSEDFDFDDEGSLITYVGTCMKCSARVTIFEADREPEWEEGLTHLQAIECPCCSQKFLKPDSGKLVSDTSIKVPEIYCSYCGANFKYITIDLNTKKVLEFRREELA